MLFHLLLKYQLISIICLVVVSISLLSAEVDALLLKASESSEEDSILAVIKPNKQPERDNAARKKENKFKCPLLFGVYSDITDCNAYYVCVGGISSRKKCNRRMHFDMYRRVCLPPIMAICDKGKGQKTTEGPTTVSDDTSTVKEDKFSCPGFFGSHPHPKDCDKFYSCSFFIPTLKTCPKDQLFDGVKKQCKPADEVHCGTRQKPTTIAPTILTPPTTPDLPETPEPTTPEPTSTPEPTTPEPTTPEPTTPEPATPEPTTPQEPTTPPKPTGPPDTDCDEDDLDCIITETGEIPDWFECPVDVGSYRHPSSKKLFIFCLNWKPFVKRCGQDMFFSEEMKTCVEV